MTTIDSIVPSGRYGLRQAARMEWIKLRSLRSTWWTLAITVAAAVGIGVAVGAATKNGSADLTNNALGGSAVGLLLIGVLGTLVATNEYTSGMVRTSLAAIPNRTVLLTAKAAVFGATALAVGEIASFIAFFAGGIALPGSISAPSLGQSDVLRAVLMSGAGYCLIGLIGVGLGAIIRHTPAAIAVLVGVVYVGTEILGALSRTLLGYVPVSIVANSITTVKPLTHALSPWAGLGLLCLYAAVTLGIGAWLLAWRDA